jgi:hypothetical protein
MSREPSSSKWDEDFRVDIAGSSSGVTPKKRPIPVSTFKWTGCLKTQAGQAFSNNSICETSQMMAELNDVSSLYRARISSSTECESDAGIAAEWPHRATIAKRTPAAQGFWHIQAHGHNIASPQHTRRRQV